jgi:hypothetical protein
VATRGEDYLFVYSAQGRRFTLTLGRISGIRLKGWWFSPRTGAATAIDAIENGGTREFVPPSEGFGADWVLVLDDAAKNYGAPGRPSARPAH